MKNKSALMNTLVHFEINQIAPCGINCGTCRAHLRDKKNCAGCQVPPGPNIQSCLKCKIRNCELLIKTNSKFCYECKEFPCLKIKKIDKRYQTRYRTSLIQNLQSLNLLGSEEYLLQEKVKWTCKNCGSVLSVHKSGCMKCGMEY
jgi:hypothetical protein